MPDLRPYKYLSDGDIKKLILHSEECMLFSQSPATLIRLSKVRALCMDEQQERIETNSVGPVTASVNRRARLFVSQYEFYKNMAEAKEKSTFDSAKQEFDENMARANMSLMTGDELYLRLIDLRKIVLTGTPGSYVNRDIREGYIALIEKELKDRAEAAEAEAAYEEAAEAEDEKAAEEAKAAKSDSPEIREKNPIHPVIGATDFPTEAPRVRKYPLVTAALRDMGTKLTKSEGQGDYALILPIVVEHRSPAYQELVNLFMAKTYISRTTMSHSVCIFLFHDQLLPFIREVLSDR